MTNFHCCIISLLIVFSLLLIGAASVWFFFFRQSTSLKGMKMVVHQSIDDSSFDWQFSQNSKSLFVATATEILRYDLEGNITNRIDLKGKILAFALTDDGTELGVLFRSNDDIISLSFSEIDSNTFDVLSEKKLPVDIDPSMKRVAGSVIWVEFCKSWMTHCEFCGACRNTDVRSYSWIAAWSHRSLEMESEIIPEQLISYIFPIPGTGLTALDNGRHFIAWDHKDNRVVIDRSLPSGKFIKGRYIEGREVDRHFAGPNPGTIAAFQERRMKVFNYETDELVFQSPRHPWLPDELIPGRGTSVEGEIVDITYPSNKALYVRRYHQYFLERPMFDLLIVFDATTMKILASEKSKNAHKIAKSVISPDGKYVATIGNWVGGHISQADTLNIYELQ